MSQTFTLTGIGNTLSSTYHPPIQLDPSYNYVLGLIGLYGCNSIRNIREGNNKLYLDSETSPIVIPPGAYEINEINTYIQAQIPGGKDVFTLKANNNTLQCEILSKHAINFKRPDTIGRLLGFSPQKLTANILHKSNLDVQIISATNIQVNCNITTGAYLNNKLSHIIYEFGVEVEPGYRIIKEPSKISYLPVNVQSISEINLDLRDQNQELIDFGSEPVTIRLELKRDGVRL